MAKNKKQRIAEAVKALRLENTTEFTLSELEAIARRAKTQVFDVMYYLRFER